MTLWVMSDHRQLFYPAVASLHSMVQMMLVIVYFSMVKITGKNTSGSTLACSVWSIVETNYNT